jgi:nucleotide-binding universal stress UspA family protein
MKLNSILVAVDNSAAGREAARSAAHVAALSGSELVVLSVAPGAGMPGAGETNPLEQVEAALGSDFFAAFPTLGVEIAGVYGLPQVEIVRFAEHRRVDLLVLGRKPRSRTARIFLGDTADSVLRRSRIPCLVVPPEMKSFSQVSVALDGSERGFMVYDYATGFAEACCLKLSAITVEPEWTGEPAALSKQTLSARSERLAGMIERRRRSGRKVLSDPGTCTVAEPLIVRHGETVAEIVAEVQSARTDVLILGFHRGGPPLVVSSGSVSRKLVHSAPCAVLTVPF